MIPTTGLLTMRLRVRQYVFLLIYVTGMAAWGTIKGQEIAILMFPVLLLFIIGMVKMQRVQNACLACGGYLISLFCNNSILYLLNSLFHLPAKRIEEKYWFVFSVGYIIFLCLLFHFLRWIFYSKSKILQSMEVKGAVGYGLLANLFLFLTIFLINITFGQRAGYSNKALLFNCLLFSVCMLVSSLLIISCSNNIKREEKRRAGIHQQEILINYVSNLERMVDEMKSFRHDYKNILSTMAGFIREDKMKDLQEFFDKQIRSSMVKEEDQNDAWKYLKNVNPMELKGFLYEKVLSALTKKIQMHVVVEREIYVEYDAMEDLVRILGIFIDNAIEAAETAVNGVLWIILSRTDCGILFRIENNFSEKPSITKLSEKGYTTKGIERGFGLFWAEEILKQHPDMYHELKILDDKLVQQLEIEISCEKISQDV